MKGLNPIFLALTLVGLSAPVNAQNISEQRQWTETFPVANTPATLIIDNIWGDVKVRAGAGSQIIVSIKELRSAPSQRLFDRSLEILKLDIDASKGGLVIQVGERGNNRWHRQDPCRGCRVDYQFDVQIPSSSNIEVSTVNDGKVDVAGISGTISASNVNGPIYIDGAHHCDVMSNVNGEVNLSFAVQPDSNCDIETINGDVALGLPPSSGLDLALDQSNGRVSSEFEVDSKSIPAKVEHIQENGLNRYKIHQVAGLRLAGGGPVFSISSLNGDIQIKKTN